MNDIHFLNITNPPQNVRQTGIADSNSTNLPPIITRFPPGTTLVGFVINRDASGNPILRTENGDITFQTNLFLKIGTELVIRIENRTGHPQAHILTIDGQPPSAQEKVSVFQQPQGQPTLPPPAPTHTNTPPQTAPITRAPAEAASVSTQPTITATLTSDTPDIPAGSQFIIKVVSAEAPAQQPSSQPSTINPSYAAYARASGNQPPQAAAFPASNSTTSQPTAISQGQIIQATVTGSTQAGETVLQTTTGSTIQLATSLPLASGIKLTFEIGTITKAVTTQLPTNVSEIPAPLPALARNWVSLGQIVSLLTADNTSLQNSGLASLYTPTAASSPPALNPQAIPAGLMVFIAALRGGDFRGWLGHENVNTLEDSGHGSLVRKAEAEFLSLGRQFAETPPNQWQSLFFPIAVHGDVQQVRFFLKRDKKQRNDRDNVIEEDTRFIVELDLSQMGELQLDGFVRKDPKNLEFDLYVRTRTQLDDATRQDIFSIYNKMAELTGYKGQLAFQTVQEFPVRPLEETHPEHLRDVSI